MKAVQLTAHGNPGKLELRELPVPALSSGEVLVTVRACGLNHLDLWLEAGALPVSLALPRTPGCEVAGDIAAVAADVTDWRVGERVAVQSGLYCGECEFCRRGEESLCMNSVLLGVERDGGLAEQVAVPARGLVRLPERVSHATAAALTLAGSTAMHMLTDRARVRPGDWVLVMGAASGVGSVAIQIARQLGARVITTASTEAKCRLAGRLGAEFVIDARAAGWTGEVRRITGKRGVDLVIEHVGGNVLEQVFHCLARGGTVVTCGATAGREVTLQLWPFFVKQHRLIGSYARNRADLVTTLAWAADGRLQPVIDRAYPLAEAGAAYTALRAGEVLGKLLVTP